MRQPSIWRDYPSPPIAVAVLLVIVVTFFTDRAFANQGPVQVTVLQVSAQDVPIKIELPTVLMGSEEVEIRARVPGRIEQIHFKDGDFIEKNQILYSLDKQPLQAALVRAKSDQAALQARLDQAIRNLNRVNTLKTQQAIAQKDVDDAISARAIAEADLLAGQARIQEAELNVAYASVKAPIAGVLSRSMVSTGDYVQGPEEALVLLTQISPIRARFSLPTRAYSAIKAEAAIGSITLPSIDEWQARLKFSFNQFYNEIGRVTFIDVRVNPLTGAQEGFATFPNTQGMLTPGQYLRIFVEGAYRPGAIAVPQEAVLDSPEGKFVYRYAKQDQGYAAQPQPVELGEWVVLNGENYWVVRQGLVPNDQIIISGHARIFAPMSPVQAVGPLQVQGVEGNVLSEDSI